MSVIELRVASLWDMIAQDDEARDAFLEEYQGLAFLIGERQTAEEWIAEMVERWCYRPPVSAHLIDNRKRGRPDVFWGPGPGGRFARRLAALTVAGYGAV